MTQPTTLLRIMVEQDILETLLKLSLLSVGYTSNELERSFIYYAQYFKVILLFYSNKRFCVYDKSIPNVTIYNSGVCFIYFLYWDPLNVTGNVILGTEIKHLLGLAYSADNRTCKTSASVDKRDSLQVVLPFRRSRLQPLCHPDLADSDNDSNRFLLKEY